MLIGMPFSLTLFLPASALPLAAQAKDSVVQECHTSTDACCLFLFRHWPQSSHRLALPVHQEGQPAVININTSTVQSYASREMGSYGLTMAFSCLDTRPASSLLPHEPYAAGSWFMECPPHHPVRSVRPARTLFRGGVIPTLKGHCLPSTQTDEAPEEAPEEAEGEDEKEVVVKAGTTECVNYSSSGRDGSAKTGASRTMKVWLTTATPHKSGFTHFPVARLLSLFGTRTHNGIRSGWSVKESGRMEGPVERGVAYRACATARAGEENIVLHLALVRSHK